MRDPIGAFYTIKDNFMRYVTTAFKTKFENLETERSELLNRDKVLYREPWIEPLPEYLSSGKYIRDLSSEDLPGLTEDQLATFKGLVTGGEDTGLAPPYFLLHDHQAKMLKKSLEGKHCIITSGTGSGKTESFLLPLFAQLSKELANWARPGQKSEHQNGWWKSDSRLGDKDIVSAAEDFKMSATVQQRSHEKRPTAMRAMILYPMNALVEDQMTRLRLALDSDPVRDWLRQEANNNSIYFGRYNGATPVSGKLQKINEDGVSEVNSSKVRSLRRELNTIDTNTQRVEQFISEKSLSRKEAHELRAFFQRLDGSEMRSRFDMQAAPPDILITNFSMLSIMLMRDVDKRVFSATRDWLQCLDIEESLREQEKPNRVFHLVIDELHLYRGTQGTEVSYLIKLLLNRLGLCPDHPQLKILASSASLESGDPRSLEYVSDFFGFKGEEDVREKFEIITGSDNPVDSVRTDSSILPYQPFQNIIDGYNSANSNIEDPSFKNACIQAGNDIAECLGISIDPVSTMDGFMRLLLHPDLELRERLFAAGKAEGEYRPLATFPKEGDSNPEHLPYFFVKIFGTEPTPQELREAARGLLISRALFDEDEYKHLPGELGRTLPRFRFHYFFRNIEGMWASTEFDNTSDERTAGELFSTPRIKTANGYRVLELLYCDNCGTTFFGGSRSIGRDNSTELLPVDPNIEGIPEKTPAKLVEKRTYQEYAVFWPQGNQEFTEHDPTPRGYWRQVTVGDLVQTEYSATWQDYSLNKRSGELCPEHGKAEKQPELWIKGKLFVINRDSNKVDVANRNNDSNLDENSHLIDTHKGLPCVCPGCGVNEQHRTKFTPVRAFRTGFAKTTQLFAKELFYQLPDNPETRKLVVFSDSREDAAQIANGIERNHFTDLIREILIRELHSGLLIKAEILDKLNTGEDASGYEESDPEAYYELEELYDDSQIPADVANPKRRQRREKAIQRLEKIERRTIKVDHLVHIINSDKCAPLIEEFIKLGINPGGPRIDLQSLPDSESNDPWFEIFDFEKTEWKGEDTEFRKSIQNSTLINLASLFFGNLFYSIEASGLGYLTVDEGAESFVGAARRSGLGAVEFQETVRSSIRIIGHRYKYFPNDFDSASVLDVNDYYSFPAQFRRYIRAVAEHHNANEQEIGNAVLEALTSANALTNNGISIRELYIKVAKGYDPVWISERGKRPHLHRAAGICTQYPRTTQILHQPQTTCAEFWEANYLSYQAAIQKRKSIRLHCEELTGQTDDQFERQRHFRNIILQDEGQPLAKTIDLLSVTTTLEVGVDIGALQAVMLANMPPQRFNYQQRVGRSGRRGQAYSSILTFCRGRSHDEFYFHHPHKITGDPPPTPFLALQQLRITKRLLAKEVLRQAFIPIAGDIQEHLSQLEEVSERRSSVHGEFGKTDYWVEYEPHIRSWITDNHDIIENISRALQPAANEEIISELTNWVVDLTSDGCMLPKICAVIDNIEIATKDISEKLAEGGILPMFGMPTSVRNLYHQVLDDGQGMYSKSIDRGTDLAIYEFAPGAQKTKDKAIHTSIGFTDDLVFLNRPWDRTVTVNSGPFYNERWMTRCRACGFIETSSTEPLENVCENCGESLTVPDNVFQIKSPKGYRTNLSIGSDSKEHSEIMLSRPPILAESNADSDISPKELNNFHASIADRDVSWRVNTNSDNFFTGKTYRVGNQFPFKPGHWFNLKYQWLLEQYAEYESDGRFVFSPNDTGNELETIALAAHKNTEILRLRPSSIPEGLNLNMFDHSRIGYAGIRSGFYSAAFMLQRVLADRLDVDPTEIEIADVRKWQIDDDAYTAELILTDELPNGSGFVRHLYDNIEMILDECVNVQPEKTYLGNIHSEEHRANCNDACYDCLKVFRNMNYHGLLDWRLGLSILRSLQDPDYVAGADGRFDEHIELQDWPNETRRLRDSFASSINFEIRDEFDLPAVLSNRNRSSHVIIIHPMWDCHIDDNGNLEMPEDTWISEQIFEIIQRVGGTDGIKFIDTFNLHRRPGWCYQKLFQ